MMLYKNTKARVPLPKGDTKFFDIIAQVLQGDTLTVNIYNLPWLHTTNVNRTNVRQTMQMI